MDSQLGGGGGYYRVKTYRTVYQSNSLAIGSPIQPATSFPGVAGWVAGLNPILQLSSAQLNWDQAELVNNSLPDEQIRRVKTVKGKMFCGDAHCHKTNKHIDIAKYLNIGKNGRRSTRSAFGWSTGNDVRPLKTTLFTIFYFFFSFFFFSFSIVYFSHRTKECLDQKTNFEKVNKSGQKPRGRH